MALRPVFGPCPPRCWGFETDERLRHKSAPTPNPQHGWPGYLSLYGISIKT
jgi:hypothetical protein